MENQARDQTLVTMRSWNKNKLIGQKSPLKPQQVWAIRVRLQLANHKRDLAIFNLALDSKLRGCDLMELRVSDIQTSDDVRLLAKVFQKKTSKPVQFEVTKHMWMVAPYSAQLKTTWQFVGNHLLRLTSCRAG